MSLNYKCLLAQIFVVTLLSSNAYAGEQEVVQALSVRDSFQGQANFQELEDLAGGKEELISVLLKYRRLETPPFVGIRSEQLLLNYTDDQQVVDALEQDVNETQYFGLARTVASKIDTISNKSARQKIAGAVLRRAQLEKRYESYGRMLKESKDAGVQKLAREALK